MATARDLVYSSLRLLHVTPSGETPGPDEAADAITALSDLLEQWSLERLMVYQQTNETFTWPAATTSRTIGATGDFTTTRPTKITHAFLRDAKGSDRSLDIITNEEYQGSHRKTDQGSWASCLMYNPSFPNGTLFLLPVPNQALTLGIASLTALTSVTLDTTLSLPPGYAQALRYNLAVRLAPEYGRTIPPEIAAIAKESKAAIEVVNQPEFRMQNDLDGFGGGCFDIQTGYFR